MDSFGHMLGVLILLDLADEQSYTFNLAGATLLYNCKSWNIRESDVQILRWYQHT
jgi:hypothetical protein